MSEMRASEIEVGDVVREYGMDSTMTVAEVGSHGDTVLITTTEGLETTFDCDTVVEVQR